MYVSRKNNFSFSKNFLKKLLTGISRCGILYIESKSHLCSCFILIYEILLRMFRFLIYLEVADFDSIFFLVTTTGRVQPCWQRGLPALPLGRKQVSKLAANRPPERVFARSIFFCFVIFVVLFSNFYFGCCFVIFIMGYKNQIKKACTLF